jgi:hypothetical protein
MNNYAPQPKPTPLGAAWVIGDGPKPLATASYVRRQIEQCHERLYRIHAILVHLNMSNQKNSGLSEFLDEAEHTFVQALGRCEARDFEGASEYIAASTSLCWLTEILLSRRLRSPSSHDGFVPFPPTYVSSENDPEVVQRDLDRVDRLLVRVRWVTENGTLSFDGRIQVERFSSWAERLSRWARHLLDTGATRDASEFTRAAKAAICSAEHLCREGYVARSVAVRRALDQD